MYSAQTTRFTKLEVQGLLQVPKGCQPLIYSTVDSCPNVFAVACTDDVVRAMSVCVREREREIE